MPVSIAIETPLQDEVRALVEELNTHLLPLSPVEFQFGIPVEEMAHADTHVFVARNEEGRAVGMGALKVHGGDLGEIKRMYTLPEVRGQRIGRAILDAITAEARRLGIGKLVLETGNNEFFADAWRLYERYGFNRCGAVLDYPDSGHSAFFERAL